MSTLSKHHSANTLGARFTQGVRVAAANCMEPQPGIATMMHIHPTLMHISCAVSGRGVCISEGRPLPIVPGRIYCLYPGTLHRFIADRNDPYRIYFIKLELTGTIPRDLQNVILLGRRRRHVESLLKTMVATANTSPQSSTEIRLVGIAAQLVAELVELAAKAKTTTRSINIDPLAEILEDFQSPPFIFPGIDTLARKTAMSRRSFTTMFRKVTGLPPHQLFNQLRMQYARHLVHTGELPISHIARECGYANPQNFIRAYKNRYGKPPRTDAL